MEPPGAVEVVHGPGRNRRRRGGDRIGRMAAGHREAKREAK